jgi:hypothetical protein
LLEKIVLNVPIFEKKPGDGTKKSGNSKKTSVTSLPALCSN